MSDFHEQAEASLWLTTGRLPVVEGDARDVDTVANILSPRVDTALDAAFIQKLSSAREIMAKGSALSREAVRSEAQREWQPQRRDVAILSTLSKSASTPALAHWIRAELEKGETVESLAEFAEQGGSPARAREIRAIGANLDKFL